MNISSSQTSVSAIRPSVATASLFIETKMASVHPELLKWVSEERVRESVNGALEGSIRKSAHFEYGQNMSKLCPVPGAEPKDYWTRLLSFEGHSALTEIRFKGMKVGCPFVEVTGSSFSLDDEDAVLALVKAVKQSFSLFSPQWVRLELGSHQTQIQGWTRLKLKADLRCLVAPVKELQRLDPPKNSDRITLKKCEDGRSYEKYRKAYDLFQAEVPTIGDEIYVIDAEAFGGLVQKGHTYDVFVEGTWAGLVSAIPEPYFGVPSFTVHEEILAKPFRGQGLAPAMQRKMIDRLDPKAGRLVFGTIHSKNQPSIATARRAGRQDVGGFFFVELS